MADPNNIINKNLDRFDDIFHQYGDDLDEDNDKYIDFDRFDTEMGSTTEHDEEDDAVLVRNMMKMESINKQEILVTNMKTKEEEEEEEHLSQKLSQLSASGQEQTTDERQVTTKKRPSLTPTTTSSSVAKKIKTNEDIEPIEWIPNYLSSSNGSFDRMLHPLFRQEFKSYDIEDLRQFAMIINHLKCIELNQTLWNKYLQSGTGELIKQDDIRSVLKTTTSNNKLPLIQYWPLEVKLQMIKHRQTTATDPKHIDHESCLDYVQRILKKYNQQKEFYENQYRIMVEQRLQPSMTDQIESAIITFVRQYGINLYRLSIDKSLAKIEFNYKDQLIQFEFHRERPNQYQKQVFENLFQLKRTVEEAKLDIAILKQRIAYKQLPKSFDSFQIPASLKFDIISNVNMRQHLKEQCEKILQRTTSDMMLVHITLAEFFRQSSDGRELDLVHRRSNNNSSNKSKSFQCSPTLIQNSIHHLTIKQIEFLNRGPSYVSPCQIHILSQFTSLSIEDLLEKQLVPLQHELTRVFMKYPLLVTRRINFENQLIKIFHESFRQPIPIVCHERILHEKYLLQSIQYQLKHESLILRRTADNQNTYYLGQLKEFEQKSNDYIATSPCYLFVDTINKQRTKQDHLKEILQFIDTQLQILYDKHLINQDQLREFSTSKRSNFKLPHLYFLPELNDNVHMIVQPRFSSFQYSPIQYLVQYLEQLIQSLFNTICHSTIVWNGNDFHTKLNYFWMQQTHPKTNIHFATFKIHDLYTHIPHRELLQALNTFLANPLIIGRRQHLSNDTIVELTSFVLRNNYFIYQDSLYRFIQGFPLNLPLTKLLGNIYLYQWQIPLVREIRLKDQFYVRFHDQGFLTWNRSLNELQTLFDELEQTLPENIEIVSSIDKQTHFLNCYIENINGRLYTRVYRDTTTTQSFLLPYFSDHPRLRYRQWYRFMMIRAVKYCDELEDFQDERRYIETTFLANGYSLDFIEYLWQQLLLHFNFSPKQFKLVDQYTYSTFRNDIYRRMKSYSEENQQRQDEEYTLIKNNKLIRLYYLFDWGSRCEFNRKFHQLWSNLLNEDPVFKEYGLKIILTSKHCYLSNTLLVPSSSKRKNLKRYLRNQQLSNNPPFTPLNDSHIVLVNKATDTNILHELVHIAQSTKYFTIDTESDLFTNCPALIQIEFIDQEFSSTIILVETCHLPIDKKSLKFWLIQSIFKYIFTERKTIFCWGCPIDELGKFLIYDLYKQEVLCKPRMIDIQDEFKAWHFKQVGFYQTGHHHPWGLQNAIYKMYNEFLDKSQQLNTWSQGLYRRPYHPKVKSMIDYAAYDCLSVTKLAVTMKQLTVGMFSIGLRSDRLGPSQLKLNDFMPTQLPDGSSNLRKLPSTFDLETTSIAPPYEKTIENESILIQEKNTKKTRCYLQQDQILKWYDSYSSTTKSMISDPANKAYILAAVPIYDECLRDNYELQVWQSYLKMGIKQKHWTKEVTQRTKTCYDVVNCQFIRKKINQLVDNIVQADATIFDVQVQLIRYWSHRNSENHQTIESIEKQILEYISQCTPYVKKMFQVRIELAKVEIEEYKALTDFNQIATPAQFNFHFVLESKVKQCSMKNKRYVMVTKRAEYDLLPKFIEKMEFSFKIDESVMSQEDAQVMYDQMHKITKDYRTQMMSLYVRSLAREYELLSSEIKRTVELFPQEKDQGFGATSGHVAFKHYHELREKRLNLEVEQSLYFLEEIQPMKINSITS
ncbi:unnamed protein product [Rotaria magnacalcarata]|uniref:Helix-turn-helix domain-containing protein n=1 Tax=Rotaria magnacalcarata TaxID=392030 RepID=A0A816Q6S6_9BILA|nr:unnamed protein product [Rotaria magnacalcarata]